MDILKLRKPERATEGISEPMRGLDRDFTLGQLRTFVCAARARSFGSAADELGISQPAVSDQIRILEERAGCRLFRRRPGTTPVLTEEGHKFLAKADQLLSASRTMRSAAGGERRRVRLSVGPRLRDFYLKPILPRLYLEHPDIELEFVPVIPASEIPLAFDQGRIDLLFYTVSAASHLDNAVRHVRTMVDVPLVMVASPAMKARFESGAVALDDMQFILPVSPHQRPEWAHDLFAELGCEPRLMPLFLDFPDVIQDMVEKDLGVTILMLEQVQTSIAAGRLAIFGQPLRPMRRILARRPFAPEAADIVERFLAAAEARPALAAL